MIDLIKLTPVLVETREVIYETGVGWIVDGVRFDLKVDADFFALARNALDIQMRTGWWAEPIFGGDVGYGVFHAVEKDGVLHRVPVDMDAFADDPFTAIVETYKRFQDQHKGDLTCASSSSSPPSQS